MPIAHWRPIHPTPRHDAWLHTNWSKEMNSYRATEMKVIQWAEARKIIPNSTPMAQAVKTAEEVAELLKALSKGDMAEAKDAYADILITLIIGADLAGFDLVDCLNDGYEVIKNRQGFLTKDGIFVKQE